jgi:hypothetical protein
MISQSTSNINKLKTEHTNLDNKKNIIQKVNDKLTNIIKEKEKSLKNLKT